MSETLFRLITLLQLVPRTPRSTTAPKLREKLAERGYEVTVRSVQRDLEGLSGPFPLLCNDTSKPYTWSWDRYALRELPGLDPPTALTFTLAHRFLTDLMPRSSLRFLEPHFRRAENELEALKHPELAAWPDKVRVLPRGQRLIPAEVRADVLDVVYEALLRGKRFTCAYHRKGETETRSYEVNPLGLVFRDAVIYLVATLWDYQDIKQLTLHRMSEPELLDKQTTRVPGFDLKEYIAEGAFGYRLSEEPIRLKVRFFGAAAQHLHETALSADQVLTVEERTGTTILEATVLDTEELRWWLLGFGDQVEVVEPEALKDEFRAMVERMFTCYSDELAKI